MSSHARQGGQRSQGSGGNRPQRSSARGDRGSSSARGRDGAGSGRRQAETQGPKPPGAAPLRAPKEPPKPTLPNEPVQLPNSVVREIDRVLGRSPRSREVALALSVGSAAIDEGFVDFAVDVLAWAKFQAPRVIAIREAYGVALYLSERYASALTELQAYRRMSGKRDQNHLIADAERAVGRDVDQVRRTVEEVLTDEQVPIERRVEAVIVWASMLAEADQVEQGRAVLRRFVAATTIDDVDAAARFDYVVGDLADKAGDRKAALAAFGRVADHDDELGDVAERIEQLASE